MSVMNNASTMALVVAIVYFATNFIRGKVMEKWSRSAGADDDDEDDTQATVSAPSFKDLAIQTCMVYSAVWGAYFIAQQFPSELGLNNGPPAPPPVFTDPPNF